VRVWWLPFTQLRRVGMRVGRLRRRERDRGGGRDEGAMFSERESVTEVK
jgi:hypothetical protein